MPNDPVRPSSAPGTGGRNAPVSLAIDGGGQVWVANGNSSVSLFSNAGAPLSPSGGFTDSSLATPGGIAIDLGRNVWIANKPATASPASSEQPPRQRLLSAAAANKTTGSRP